MDLKELKARHPELVQELSGEIRGQWEEEKQKITAEAQANVLALARALGGGELATKIETAARAGINAGQITALAPMLAHPAPAKSGEQESREKMLNAITQASGGPLPADAPRAGGSRLVADAMRRAGGN